MTRPSLLVLLLAGCAPQALAPPPPPLPAEITVSRVTRSFPIDPRRTQVLIAALDAFVAGRMDALHVALPGHAASLRDALIVAGVRPRKIRTGAPPGTLLAERYLATVPPCPPLDLEAAGFGDNPTRPGFGCATLANVAAETSDPADLLGNTAASNPDSQRAALPVAAWRSVSPPAPQAPR